MGQHHDPIKTTMLLKRQQRKQPHIAMSGEDLLPSPQAPDSAEDDWLSGLSRW